MEQDHRINFFSGAQWRHMHEYAKNCIQYNIPNTVNNIPTIIIDKIYTHSMQGLQDM